MPQLEYSQAYGHLFQGCLGFAIAELGQMRSFTNRRYQVVDCQYGSADVPASSSTIATLCFALVTAT